jgi:hypothetical protein
LPHVDQRREWLRIIAFLVGVASAIVGTILVGIFGQYLPIHLKVWLTTALSRALHSGIDRIYKDENSAANDILADASDSRQIRILSIRGFRLTSAERPLSRLLSRDNSYDTLEIMISPPDSPAAMSRAQMFSNSAVTYGDSAFYLQDVAKSINVLVAASRDNDRIHVRLHDQCESFRLLITDRNLYLSFFPKGRPAATSPVYRIRNDALLYHAFVTHYSWIRDQHSEQCVRYVKIKEADDANHSD